MRPRDLWYKAAVIYELDVRTYADSNGDGWGDFQGLIRKLDYIAGLGVTCIWLKPFNTSPHRDGGYDIVDHYSVDGQIGSMGDFVDFMEQAASRGIAVIVDLVANHTSIDHPWFQEAASSPDSPLRDFYIWRDEPTPPDESPERIIYSGDDTSVWSQVDGEGQYYLHRFYPHEPDLNNANPLVREEIYKVLAFYLRLGVAGFRIDAAPYVAEKAAEAEEYADPHEYLREMRSFLSSRRPDAAFMAEADVDPDQLDEYFGNGDEMNLLLNFLMSEYLFLALAEGDSSPIHDLVDLLPTPPPAGQYANFLRNHDELDLERLDDSERELVLDTFAPDPGMRLFDRGLRRRLAPMLDGDQDRIRLAHSLQFAMPGTPVIYYGDEIGMGDDLNLPERLPVRTPMQWTSEPNGGFSSAAAENLHLPPIEGGPYGYRSLNVADQLADPESMLNWMRRLVSTRKESRPMIHGAWSLEETGEPAVFGIRYEDDDDLLFVYHNLSDSDLVIEAPETSGLTYVHEAFSDSRYDPVEIGASKLEINRYGYRWLRGQAEPRDHTDSRTELRKTAD